MYIFLLTQSELERNGCVHNNLQKESHYHYFFTLQGKIRKELDFLCCRIIIVTRKGVGG